MSNTLQKNHAKNMEDILEAKRLRYGKKLKKTMSDTPETDAAWKEGNAIREWTCRKLERERDFSRNCHALAVESISAWKERAEKAERERDEARADAHNYKEGYHIYSLQADFIERKLNETKKQIKELISIAGRAISLAEIDVDNDKFGIVSELRYELKQIMQEGAK
jgi:hypothetical protein